MTGPLLCQHFTPRAVCFSVCVHVSVSVQRRVEATGAVTRGEMQSNCVTCVQETGRESV